MLIKSKIIKINKIKLIPGKLSRFHHSTVSSQHFSYFLEKVINMNQETTTSTTTSVTKLVILKFSSAAN
jgi:hypothetical protein